MVRRGSFEKEIVFETSKTNYSINSAKIFYFFLEDGFVLLVVERNRSVLIDEKGTNKEKEVGQAEVNIAARIKDVEKFLSIKKQFSIGFFPGIEVFVVDGIEQL